LLLVFTLIVSGCNGSREQKKDEAMKGKSKKETKKGGRRSEAAGS